MKASKGSLTASVMALAVQGALAAMAATPMSAMAEDDEVAELVNPTNHVSIGVGSVSADSTKFGEYNGLHERGAYAVGGFDVRGGDAYGQGSGTTRWSVNGQDLGTTSRSIDASVSSQGRWSLGIGYDELRHYTTSNYQTPYLGSMGGNIFTLPSNFGVINTSQSAAGTSGGATLLGGRSLRDTQLGEFRTQDVYTQRENTNFTAGYDFNSNWNFKFDFNHLEQSGAKLIGSGTDPATARTGAFGGISTWKGEVPIILMNPTSYQTETFNAVLNWTGERGHVSVGYFGSLFHDTFNGVSWSNPFQSSSPTGTVLGQGLPMSTMSLPPSNEFHQINLNGGYTINPKTKVIGGLSYGINSQNESFNGTYVPGYALNLPGNSLSGKVINTHADVKLINQTTKDLTLSGGLKYNERDNRTDSGLYTYYDEGNKLREAWSTPMSNRKTQLELAGDYRLTSAQKLHLGYELEKIERWCNNGPSLDQIVSAMTFTGTTFSAANIANAKAYYANGTSCAQVPDSMENRFVANYKLRANDAVTFNAGYSYGNRHATVNSSFYNAMQSVTEGFENPGFVAYFDASRRENLFKTGVNWQATNKLNIGLSGKYRKDEYTDSPLGVSNGSLSSLNLDASYAYSERSMVSAYATWQWRSRDLQTEAGRLVVAQNVSPVGPWSNRLSDDDVTLGVNGRQNGLFGGRLDLFEDLTYALAKTNYNTSVFYAVPSGTSGGCSATSNMSCGEAPTIKSEMWQLKLSGNYHLDKVSSILGGYQYRHLSSNDYFYNVYQYPYGFTSGLPTNQQAPRYSVSAVFLAYQYSFR